MPYDDDDDWVGTPPEGRHTRDQADPDFWARQRFLAVGGGLLGLVLVILLLAIVLS